MIINNDCLDEMRKMDSNSISAIVTDPPYGLGFMGKDWDAGLPHEDIWKEALRICKPGSFLLAFGGTRTYHRLTCAIEDAGWEIRDCLQWIYGSGFPKSHNHFGIEGYGTALKPAYEPIIMAMKPCDGTFANNAEKWGQAGINIDGCRIGQDMMRVTRSDGTILSQNIAMAAPNTGRLICGVKEGRWPANILFDEEAAQVLNEQSGHLGKSSGGKSGNTQAYSGGFTQDFYGDQKPGFGDSGGASRFFYCAKTSSRERNEGLDFIEKNNHPTVKPAKLMKYLITLVMPPKDGVLLDPFAGSGSTILAAHQLGVKAIGIEKSAEYCEIAKSRLDNYKPKVLQPDLFQVA